ncbi:hypothetical protein PM082_009693 [Marasmius tenuissimus]|nr:hypothetical protein PM082_009693 [Marasmius tenuissimus]
MRPRRPLLFILHILFERSAGFDIEVPAQAKFNEEVTVTWTHKAGDPTKFAIAAVPTPQTPEKVLIFGWAEVSTQQTATMKATISNDKWKTLTVGAYEISSTNVAIFLAPGQMPNPFYTHSPPISIGDISGPKTQPEDPNTRTGKTSSLVHPTAQRTSLGPSKPASQDSTANTVTTSVTASTSSGSSTSPIGGHVMGAGTQSQSTTRSGSQIDQSGGYSDSPDIRKSHQQSQLPGPSSEPVPTSTSGASPQTRQSNIGTILGAVLGVLILLISIILAIICCRRRNKNHHNILWKPAGRPITFFKDKMVHRSDDQSETGEKSLPGRWDSDREWLPTSVFAAHSIHEKDTDGMSLTDSLTTDLPLSTAYAYTITEYESDITSTIAGGLSEVSNNAKGGVYGAGARTDRQMEIEGKIFELQREILRMRAAGGDPTDVAKLRDRIERLRQLQGGKWAMELSNEVPSEMVH